MKVFLVILLRNKFTFVFPSVFRVTDHSSYFDLFIKIRQKEEITFT